MNEIVSATKLRLADLGRKASLRSVFLFYFLVPVYRGTTDLRNRIKQGFGKFYIA